MTIQWVDFLQVVVTALVAAVVVVGLFAGGIRLLATPGPEVAPTPGAPRDEEFDDVPRGRRATGVTAAAVTLFSLAGAVALLGVVLLVTR